MNKKNTLVIFAFFSFIILFLVIFISSRKYKVEQPETPLTITITPPQIQLKSIERIRLPKPIDQAPLNIRFTTQEFLSHQEGPRTLQTYSLILPQVQSFFFTKITESLGFSPSPSLENDVRIEWMSGKKRFTITKIRHSFSLSSENPDSKNDLFEPPLKNSPVESFITKYGLIPKTFTISLLSREPFPISGYTGNFPIESLSLLTYEVQIDRKYPIVPSPDINTNITALVTPDGFIYSISGPVLPNDFSFLKTESVVDPDNALGLLNDNYGTLISALEKQGKYEKDAQSDFTNVQIKQFFIGYFLLPGKETLIPVYVFKGTGKEKERVFDVTYILRATY